MSATDFVGLNHKGTNKVSRLLLLHISATVLIGSSNAHHRVQQSQYYSECLSLDITKLYINKNCDIRIDSSY